MNRITCQVVMSINGVDWSKTSIQELAMYLEFDWTGCSYSVDILNSSTGTCLRSLWKSLILTLL